jgi:hypothetical protein
VQNSEFPEESSKIWGKSGEIMARRVFFSFYYAGDGWRASQVRNIGAIEGSAPCSDNDWETVKRGGDKAIERWITRQLSGRSCTVVLVGSKTASRKWVIHEIQESWNANKGVVGIRIDGLKDRKGRTSSSGPNPFDKLTLSDGLKLSSVVKLYDPWGWTSTGVYENIKNNIATWVEEAIQIRERK